MLCKEITEIIERKYNKKYALSWDNVGLLAGRSNKEVEKIFVALDATDDVVDAAIEAGADMLITHHPLIMSGLTKITDDHFTGRRLLKMIQKDMSYYAMHTNYDVCGMADLSQEKLNIEHAEVLEVTCEDGKGIGRIFDLQEETTLRQYCDIVKKAFSLENVKVFGELNCQIKRIAICPGSGKSVISTAIAKGADALITGDIGHHDGIDAVAQNMAIIDAGHYGIEHIFMKDMVKYLKENLCNVEVLEAEIKHPFVVI